MAKTTARGGEQQIHAWAATVRCTFRKKFAVLAKQVKQYTVQ